MRRILMILLFASLCAGVPRAPAEPPAALETLKTNYGEALDVLKQQAGAALEAPKADYLRALANLEAAALSSERMAIRREVQRMSAQSYLPDEAMQPALPSLHRLQVEHQARLAASAFEPCQRIARLGERYVEVLVRLRFDQSPSATAYIEAEIMRAKNNPVALLARTISQRHENPLELPALPEPPSPVPEQPVANPEPARPPLGVVARSEWVREAPATPAAPAFTLYTPGTEPPQRTRRDALLHTGMQSRAAVGYFQVEASNYTDESNMRTSRSGNYQSVSGRVRYVPRLNLRYINQTPLDSATLVVQYFSKPSSGNVPVPEHTEHITLPAPAQHTAWIVDTAGLEASIHEYRSGNRVTSRSGKELSSYIVSIYAPNGALLFQQGTLASLARFAVSEMPPATAPKGLDPVLIDRMGVPQFFH